MALIKNLHMREMHLLQCDTFNKSFTPTFEAIEIPLYHFSHSFRFLASAPPIVSLNCLAMLVTLLGGLLVSPSAVIVLTALFVNPLTVLPVLLAYMLFLFQHF